MQLQGFECQLGGPDMLWNYVEKVTKGDYE